MKEGKWRQRILGTVQPKAAKAAREILPAIGKVEYDFDNGVFRFELPVDSDDDSIEDAIANAIKSATGVAAHCELPPIFYFDPHIRNPPTLVHAPGVDANGLMPVRIKLSELHGLRDVYNQFAAASKEFDYCVTFATGGLPLMFHITDALDKPMKDETQTYDAFQDEIQAFIRESQKKHHVFEGLNWKKPESEDIFRDWLLRVPEERSLLILDTAISGSGVNRAGDVVRSTMPRPKRVEIVGALDRSRGHSPEPTITNQPTGYSVETRFIPVPRIITEDNEEWIGYDRLKSIGGLKSLWGTAIVEVVDDETGAPVTVIGTGNLAHVVGELTAKCPVGPTLDKTSLATSLYMAGINIIRLEREKEVRHLTKAKAAKLIDEPELSHELVRATKHFDAMKLQCERRSGLADLRKPK